MKPSSNIPSLIPSPWRRAVALSSLALLALAPSQVLAAFGLSADPTFYTVDTGAGLVFKIRRIDLGSNTQSPGDIASLVYNGVEYQDQVRGSQVTSGFDWLYSNTSLSTVSAETIGTDFIKVTVQAGELTHYYMARKGYPHIYMGTYFTSEPDIHGLVRYIVRIPSDLLPNGPEPSDIRNNIGAIESSDVFGLANGETRSKHYSNMRLKDWSYFGATGNNVGVWFVRDNNEGGSGGPFYRSLLMQTASDQELTYIVNYGEAQTEAYRVGVLNHYTLVFTDGATPPATLDTSWFADMNLLGFVAPVDRGRVAGTATGLNPDFEYTIGFSNASAQHWTDVSVVDGSFDSAGMRPGTYKATLYKGELAVAVQENVLVTAGVTTTLDIVSAEPKPSVIFRIGAWDGMPAGFMNADKITKMHPSDVRMTPWGPITYTVGVDDTATFPSIQFRLRNSPATIKFDLAPNQIVGLTLNIGITCNYAGGRPQIGVNNVWTSAVPPAPTQPGTRTFTVGTYRGNNTTFTYAIPASALVAGTNTLTITPASGTSDLGPWLSAGYVFDAVELVGPIATPVITYVGGNPLVIRGTAEAGRTVALTLDGSTSAGTAVAAANGTWSLTEAGALSGGTHSFTAVASDGAGHDSPASATYSFNNDITMPVIVSAPGDTGTFVDGDTTSDRVFSLTGTASPGATVALTRVGVGAIGTTVADGSGNWTFDYTTVSLPDGANVFYATVTDGGQISRSSPLFTLTLSGAPRVAIQRLSPTQQIIPSGIGSVVFRVTFNHAVSGVSNGAFALATTDSATGSVATVSANSGTEFDVTADVSGVGSVRLDLVSNNWIVDTQGNPEAGYSAGQSYTLVLATTGDGTWIEANGGGLWSNPSNWDNAVIADGAANTADFSMLDLTTDNTAQLDSARTINRVLFGDAATSTPANWTLGNKGAAENTLTLAGTTPSIVVNGVTGGTGTAFGADGTVARVNARLAGTGGLAKTGAGTLVLGAANTFTGALNLTTGYIEVPSGGALSLGNGAVNLAANTQLQVSGGSLTTGGLVTVNTGKFILNSGMVTMGSYRTAGSFNATLQVNGGTLNVGAVNITRNAGTSPSYGSGVIIAGGTVTTGEIGLGTLNSYGNMSIEGGLLTATGTITVGNQQSAARGGALRVIGGTFFSTDTALGILMCRNNGTNTNNVGQAIFTAGVSTVEKFTLGFDSSVTGGSATITINGGTLYLGSGGIVKNGAATMATNLNFSSGVFGAKASWFAALPITLPANGNITFQTANEFDEPFDITLDGVLSGAGGFTKTGNGTLTLGGANTFTGPVALNAGLLRVTGSLASGGTLQLNGGTIAGDGTINKTAVLNGATIAPDGSSTLALNGTSLTWNSGGRLAIALGANGESGRLALTGALLKGTPGTYEIAFAPGAGFTAGNTYTIATFGSTDFSTNDFIATGLPEGYAAIFSIDDTRLEVTVKAITTLTLANLVQWYDGTPRVPTATTDPSGLNVIFVYGTDLTAPTYPGVYEVFAVISDPVYTGSASGTLVITTATRVRHAPTLNGILDGSVQMLLPESLTLKETASLAGDLLVPGKPAVVLKGEPMLAGVLTGPGADQPTSHTVTINDGAVLRYLVLQVDGMNLPEVAAPLTPSGTRSVTLRKPGQSAGVWETLRDLTLNGGAGTVAVPPGAYGTFTANGETGFILGTAGATEPAHYDFENLLLNGTSTLQLVGPVNITLANGTTFSGSAGDVAHPEWLTLQVHAGGVTLNTGATFDGKVIAPSGIITINEQATLRGSVAAEDLTINSGGLLEERVP